MDELLTGSEDRQTRSVELRERLQGCAERASVQDELSGQPGAARISTAPDAPMHEDKGLGDRERRADGDGEVAAAISRLEQQLISGLADIRQSFESRLGWDRHKDAQIDRLHTELQEYKTDLLSRSLRPLILGIIRLHDDLGRQIAALNAGPELTPARLLDTLEGFADDIELLLERHGVERYSLPGDVFDPRRQTALRTCGAADASLVGRVFDRLRPGFCSGEVVLQKERVAVYAAENVDDPQPCPAPEPQGPEHPAAAEEV